MDKLRNLLARLAAWWAALDWPTLRSRAAAWGWGALCTAHRLLRRWNWAYLFVLGALSYPWQMAWVVSYAVRLVPTADRQAVAAATWGKLVDPVLFFSKTSISVGVFCLTNLLAWASLLVVPVLMDWALSYYKEPKADFPATRGFKGTFLLDLTGWQRMLLFVLVWGVELHIASESIKAGFTIQ